MIEIKPNKKQKKDIVVRVIDICLISTMCLMAGIVIGIVLGM